MNVTTGRPVPPDITLSPSILAADQLHLARDLELVLTGPDAADALHVDVMDGHFVDNQHGGPMLVEALRRFTDVDLDAHLMIERPGRTITTYAGAGATSITVHREALDDPVETAAAIRAAGLRAGLALRPGTPVADVAPFVGAFDVVLVMTVQPGRGGQPFLESSPVRIAQVRRLVDEAGNGGRVQVDGGIDRHTIGSAARAGASMFVAGSAVFGDRNPSLAVRSLRAIARSERR